MNLSNNRNIPDALRKAAKQRTDDVLARLRTAMTTMQRETEANDGLYPHNRGRITQSEVCRRARVSKVTLQGPAHKTSTKVIVDQWVTDRTTKRAPEIRSVVTERADKWKADHAKVATQYALAMLDLVEAETRVRALEQQNADLREQLRAASNGKIVQLVPEC